MFFGCTSLKDINIKNLNVDNVICMDKMFYGCPAELKLKVKEQNNLINNDAFNENNDDEV